MLRIGTPMEVKRMRVTREIRFDWREQKRVLETHGTSDISYRVCPVGYRSPEYRGGVNIELLDPNFHDLQLTSAGINGDDSFGISLAVLSCPQLYRVLLDSKAFHYSKVREQIQIRLPEREGLLQITSGTPRRFSGEWRGELLFGEKKFGDIAGRQFRTSEMRILEKYERLATPFNHM